MRNWRNFVTVTPLLPIPVREVDAETKLPSAPEESSPLPLGSESASEGEITIEARSRIWNLISDLCRLYRDVVVALLAAKL